jgi:alkyl hydroperoxide reductase subunit AhpF
MYELAIIGGGPAGCSAAVYAARKKLKTILITSEWGGQSIVSETIYNWIGTPEISGHDLAKSFQTHVEYYEGEDLTINVKQFSWERSTSNPGTVCFENPKYLSNLGWRDTQTCTSPGSHGTTGSHKRITPKINVQ